MTTRVFWGLLALVVIGTALSIDSDDEINNVREMIPTGKQGLYDEGSFLIEGRAASDYSDSNNYAGTVPKSSVSGMKENTDTMGGAEPPEEDLEMDKGNARAKVLTNHPKWPLNMTQSHTESY